MSSENGNVIVMLLKALTDAYSQDLSMLDHAYQIERRDDSDGLDFTDKEQVNALLLGLAKMQRIRW